MPRTLMQRADLTVGSVTIHVDTHDDGSREISVSGTVRTTTVAKATASALRELAKLLPLDRGRDDQEEATNDD